MLTINVITIQRMPKAGAVDKKEKSVIGGSKVGPGGGAEGHRKT